MTREMGVGGYLLRRREGFACTVRRLARAALVYHRIVVEGAEHLPCHGAALILPKHRAYRDILVEGVVLYQVTGRYGTYVMKVGLWRVLEAAGGIRVVRPKDVRRIKDRERRRAEIRRARQANQDTLEYLAWLYAQGEMVVSHPEGMRHPDGMGPLQKEVVEHLLQVESQLGVRIPIIPVGFEYESFARPGSRVFMRVGEPLCSSQASSTGELLALVTDRIRVLSGCA